MNLRTLEQPHDRRPLAEMHIQATVAKVTDLDGISSYGVMRTPGLVTTKSLSGREACRPSRRSSSYHCERTGDSMKEWLKFALLAAAFLVLYYRSIDTPLFLRSISAGLSLLQEYARLTSSRVWFRRSSIAALSRWYVKRRMPSCSFLVPPPEVHRISGCQHLRRILAVCSSRFSALTGLQARTGSVPRLRSSSRVRPSTSRQSAYRKRAWLGFRLGRLVAAIAISVMRVSLWRRSFASMTGRVNGAFAAGMSGESAYSNFTVLGSFSAPIAILVVFGCRIDPALKAD